VTAESFARDPTASALARPAPTLVHAKPAAIRSEAHVTNVVDIHGMEANGTQDPSTERSSPASSRTG